MISSEALPIPRVRTPEKSGATTLAITISRQTGSGAHCVAEALARYLQARTPKEAPSWAVYDRNLVERVLQDHNLPARLARFMPEDRVPELVDALDELLGVHPPVSKLVEQTIETVLLLAKRGNAILIGRGAHLITSGLEQVFHVRLVGSLEKRIEHFRERLGLDRKEAAELIRREDRGRSRYLKKYFGKDIDDPLSYHLVVNTDSVPYESAARLIGEAALSHLQAEQRRSEANAAMAGKAAEQSARPEMEDSLAWPVRG